MDLVLSAPRWRVSEKPSIATENPAKLWFQMFAEASLQSVKGTAIGGRQLGGDLLI